MDDRELDVLLEFLNTTDVETGEDELADDPAWRAWAQAHGLEAAQGGDGADAAAARSVRDALRAAIDEGVAPGADALGGVRLPVRFAEDGRPVLDPADALARLVATAVLLAAEGRWRRVKLCGAHTCRYAFYDASRNHSGRWCSMAVCGNREKTRAFRERHRSGSAAHAG